MVSICIATYNGEKRILKQLQSILLQIGEKDEIIISDDGSQDSTVDIAKKLGDPRIKIFHNQGKKGPSANFENSLVQSKGSIIFLSDQDDEWLPTKLQQHLQLHEEFDTIVSDAVVVDSHEGVIYSSFISQRRSKKGLLNNLRRNSYIGCCMSFKRKILDKALPFPDNIHMHDWWIGLVAEKEGSVCFTNEVCLKYYRHESNASQTLVRTLPFSKQLENRLVLIINLIRRFIFNV